MKNVRKYVLAALATAVLVTAAAGSALADNNKYYVHPRKPSIQHKKPPVAAHRIVQTKGRKSGDFAHLNR